MIHGESELGGSEDDV